MDSQMLNDSGPDRTQILNKPVYQAPYCRRYSSAPRSNLFDMLFLFDSDTAIRLSKQIGMVPPQHFCYKHSSTTNKLKSR